MLLLRFSSFSSTSSSSSSLRLVNRYQTLFKYSLLGIDGGPVASPAAPVSTTSSSEASSTSSPIFVMSSPFST